MISARFEPQPRTSTRLPSPETASPWGLAPTSDDRHHAALATRFGIASPRGSIGVSMCKRVTVRFVQIGRAGGVRWTSEGSPRDSARSSCWLVVGPAITDIEHPHYRGQSSLRAD